MGQGQAAALSPAPRTFPGAGLLPASAGAPRQASWSAIGSEGSSIDPVCEMFVYLPFRKQNLQIVARMPAHAARAGSFPALLTPGKTCDNASILRSSGSFFGRYAITSASWSHASQFAL